jgi:hypothetical protein
MSNVVQMPQQSEIERVLIGGDLAKLSPDQRVSYYNKTCETLGLNPLTRPFDYITLQGKMTLYARKDATEQLRKIHGVSIRITRAEKIDDIFLVVAEATDKNGRVDAATGAVSIAGMKGDNLANALMKAETKSKRRVTLSICGLGLLDETEIETIPDAVKEAPKTVEAPKPEIEQAHQNLGDYKISFGKWKGHALSYIGLEGKDGLLEYVDYIERAAQKDNKPIKGQVAEFINAVKAYAQEQSMEDNIKF